MDPISIPPFDLADVAARLEALGNPTRLAIYRILVRSGGGGLAVGELQRRLGSVVPSTLSHHLRRLIEVNLVTQERRTTTLICRANFPSMRRIIGFLTEECCADAETGIGASDTDETAAAGCCDPKP